MKLGSDSASPYRADIDGLRAIAILSVMGFHAFPTFFRGGFLGVDIFFVISGFLISSIIFAGLNNRTFSFVDFYSRRIRRIFPALLLILAVTLAAGWFVLLDDEYVDLAKSATTGATFTSNLMLWLKGGGYFQQNARETPLLHLWSLGIEEQFYILWPLLLWALWHSTSRALHVVILVGVASFCLNVADVRTHPTLVFYAPQTRFWELSIGAALGYVLLFRRRDAERMPRGQKHALSAIGALLVVAGWLLITEQRDTPGWGLLPTLGTASIIAAGPQPWLNRTVLAHPVLVWVGVVSYPLYLWHWPLISFGYILSGGGTPSLVFRCCALVVALILAWVTYVAVERPIRSSGRLRAKAVALIALMGGVGLIAVSSYVYEKARLSADPEVDTQPLHYVANRDEFSHYRFMAEFRSSDCVKALPSLQKRTALCRMAEDMTPTVALLGDSHAAAIFDFVNQTTRTKTTGLILLGEIGCPPFLGVERDRSGCPQVMADAVQFITEHAAITDVLITGRLAATFTGLDFGQETYKDFYPLSLIDNPSVTDRRVIFETGLEAMLRTLTQHGKRVTILLDVPELNFDPKKCLESRGHDACTLSRSLFEQRRSGYVEVVRELQIRYRVRVVDLADAFCDAQVCSAKSGEHILYLDSHHLGMNGNVFLARSGIRLQQVTQAQGPDITTHYNAAEIGRLIEAANRIVGSRETSTATLRRVIGSARKSLVEREGLEPSTPAL